MNPIVALWSHPRSMSTALERVMRERGDLDCAHEPFLYYFYVGQNIRQLPHFEVQKNHPICYEGLRDMLLERAEKQPVFFKDMSYYVIPRIAEDHDFCRRLTNCFLIRNPLSSIPSHHKLDPELTQLEVGIEAQWNHFAMLEQLLESAPAVVQAEDIRNNPKVVIAALWKELGLDYCDDAFNWSTNSPDDWKQVDGWHGSVSNSQSIRPVTQQEIDGQQGKFDKCAKGNPQLNNYLEHHLPYYHRLLKRALSTSS